jgi:hypothetical protein
LTHRIENAPNVDVKNTPILSFGSLLERAFPFNAGIVKRNVETAEFVDREIDHRFDVGIFATSARTNAASPLSFSISATTCAPSLSRRPVKTTFAPAREFDRCGLADTGSSSGYERNFA